MSYMSYILCMSYMSNVIHMSIFMKCLKSLVSCSKEINFFVNI